MAFVELSGVRHYLGAYGSKNSRREYHRLLAEWEANGRQLPAACDELDVEELTARFLTWAVGYYKESKEPKSYRTLIRLLNRLYGDLPAADFGPRALKTVRSELVKAGRARRTCNHAVHRIRRIWRWAVEEELVSATVYQALLTVRSLRRGRSDAKETPPVAPVPLSHVDETLPFLSRQLQAIVEVQRLTGARSGEILPMRPCDMDRRDDVWTYKPPSHKTAYRGHERTIFLGPAAQKVIRPFLRGRGPRHPLFSPREAEEERRAKQHAERKTPLSCGNVPGSNRKAEPRRRPRETYTTESYGRAIARACKLARVPHWSPHRLRHSRATEIRRLFGLEAASVILGHRECDVTQIYAAADVEKAREIMKAIG